MNSLQRDQMIETFYLCGIKKAPSIKRLLDRAKVQASERTRQRKIKNLMEEGVIEEEKTTKKGRPSALSDDNIRWKSKSSWRSNQCLIAER